MFLAGNAIQPERIVGAAGFEPTAFCAQGRRATKLRYAPKYWWAVWVPTPLPFPYEGTAPAAELPARISAPYGHALIPRAPAQRFDWLWWLAVLRGNRTAKAIGLIDDLVEFAIRTGNAATCIPEPG